jgi:K+-sensing histidine kinase KdpD
MENRENKKRLPNKLSELKQRIAELESFEEIQNAIYRISEAAQSTQTLDELYASIHAIISKLMPARNFYITLYNEATGMFDLPYMVDEYDETFPSYKPGKGLGAYIMRTGQPLLATSEVFGELERTGQVEIISRRMIDWLGVPLKAQNGKTIGVMAIQTYSENEQLTEANKDVLVFVSTQVTMAIERKQAEQAHQKRAQELAALNRLGQQINASLSLDQVINASLTEVRMSTSCDQVFFYLYQDQGLILINSSPPQQNHEDHQIEIYQACERICSQAVQKREAIFSNGFAIDTHNQFTKPHQPGFQSMAALPLCSGMEILGVLGIAFIEVHDFGDQGTFLETMASQIATSVRNALLHQQMQSYAIELEQHVAARTAQYENANKELAAFSYSVSHDLRTPLRAINGYAQILLEDYADTLDKTGKEHLARICSASQRMSQLIDDLLKLSRLTRQEMTLERVDLGSLARDIVQELAQAEADRKIEFIIGDDMIALADSRLLRILLENLLSNAVKFTRQSPQAVIEFNQQEQEGEQVFFVRDNGIGFDMKYVDKLFKPFERLHPASEYEGSGIGLATVQRIIQRHGGRAWAQAQKDQGATLYFTLT